MVACGTWDKLALRGVLTLEKVCVCVCVRGKWASVPFEEETIQEQVPKALIQRVTMVCREGRAAVCVCKGGAGAIMLRSPHMTLSVGCTDIFKHLFKGLRPRGFPYG